LRRTKGNPTSKATISMKLFSRVAAFPGCPSLLNQKHLTLQKGSSSDLSAPACPPYDSAATGAKTPEFSDTSEKCRKSKL